MGVKLLPKSKLAELKASQTSREIAEGLKVANRVDGLREVWAKTEQDFESYKISALAQINDEISQANIEKDKVFSELRRLKEEYDTLLPEIPMKRAELAKFEKKLFAWERKLEKREEKSALAEIDIAEAVKGAESARFINEDNERISRNILVQANRDREEAKNTLKTARGIHDQAVSEQQSIEAGLILREYAMGTREKEISKKELALINDRGYLEKEREQVKDQRDTLQRSLARIKEGRLA